jgi:hypothetical protein
MRRNFPSQGLDEDTKPRCDSQRRRSTTTGIESEFGDTVAKATCKVALKFQRNPLAFRPLQVVEYH